MPNPAPVTGLSSKTGKNALELIRKARQRDLNSLTKTHTLSSSTKAKLANASTLNTKGALQRMVSIRRSKEAISLRERVEKLNSNLSKDAERVIFFDLPQCIIDIEKDLKENPLLKDMTVYKKVSEVYQRVLKGATNILSDVSVLPLPITQRRMDKEIAIKMSAADEKNQANISKVGTNVDMFNASTPSQQTQETSSKYRQDIANVKAEIKKHQLKLAKENLKRLKTLYSTLGFVDIEAAMSSNDSHEKWTSKTAPNCTNPELDTTIIEKGSAKGYIELSSSDNCIFIPHPLLLSMFKSVEIHVDKIINMMTKISSWFDHTINDLMTSQKNPIKEETQEVIAQMIEGVTQMLEEHKSDITEYHNLRGTTVVGIQKCPCYNAFAMLSLIDLKIALVLGKFIDSIKLQMILIYNWFMTNYDMLINAREMYTTNL